VFESVKKRKRSLILAVVAVLALTAGAVAYWTASGAGTGTGDAAGAQQALTVNQTTTLDPMYPGDSPQLLSGNFDNPNPGPIRVGTVTVSIASITKAAGAVAGTCDATDFTLADAVMTVNAEVPSGNGKGSWTGATIKFNNKAGANQDACKGATVNLSYTTA
jgi:predicted metal-binding membrane protein